MSSTATETGAGGPALAPAVTGFICPICPGMVQLESEALLLEHWALIHDAKDVGGASVTEDQFGDTSLVLDHVFEENSVRKARVCRHCNDRIGWGKCCTCKLCRSYCHTHCAEQMMKTACPGFVRPRLPSQSGVVPCLLPRSKQGLSPGAGQHLPLFATQVQAEAIVDPQEHPQGGHGLKGALRYGVCRP